MERVTKCNLDYQRQLLDELSVEDLRAIILYIISSPEGMRLYNESSGQVEADNHPLFTGTGPDDALF